MKYNSEVQYTVKEKNKGGDFFFILMPVFSTVLRPS